ncbi:uncharacterized protein HD556DRAFT_1482324 [Suillus plorans]|uniref:Uncharacterized protein n=1 Tax=Suillus plorans TaxID=116603 RepID=A0A9P7DFL2_9AGAM|nr:uncharacterized protein HD556DRAFT_1482324 [Suillus plorans]KAG1792187.1 hypothetical protein HD556DRAFT_1482324 [Suillus plorans]
MYIPPFDTTSYSILTSLLSSIPTSLPSIPETLTTRTSSPSTMSVTNLSTLGQQTSSQQSTSDNPQNVTPQSSQTSSSDSPTPTLPTTFPGGSPTTVPGAQSSHIPQSPCGSPVNTTLHSPFAGVAKNVISTTSPITHSGDAFSSITYTSIGTSTITTYSCFGSTSALVTLTSSPHPLPSSYSRLSSALV